MQLSSTVDEMAATISTSLTHFPSTTYQGDSPANLHSKHRLLELANECKHISQLKQIHAQALRTSVCPHNPPTLFLYSRILNFLSLVDIDYAHRVFNHIEASNSFMWNVMIRAYARSSKMKYKEKAIELFKEMVEDENVMLDKHTFPFVLKACSYLFCLFVGRQVHANIFKIGFESDIHINNSLIHLYATCGCLDLAMKIFYKMSERSEVSWNIMIDALVNAGQFDNALKLFVEMQDEYEPDRFTMQSVINACAGLGALSLGLWAHAYMLRISNSDIVSNVFVNGCLVKMYCKCGSLELAQQVFESMSTRDVNAWNSIILGFAIHGKAEAALEYFGQMVNRDRVKPNSVTFLCVLNACKHRGMVSDGKMYFKMMVQKYNIEPRLEHYGCLVHLLAHAGYIDEALDLVSGMPFKPDPVIWRILLDACCKQYTSLELREELVNQILESEGGTQSGVYVLLSKVYASASRWNDVGLIRKLMTDKGVSKEPGCSIIEVDGVIHEFFSGDTSHPQSTQIYRVVNAIDEKLEWAGYSPDYSGAQSVDETDDRKRHCLRHHSERLAIAYGLLNSKPGMPIRIFKNLRVCNDCHNVTKLISKMLEVEIIVRDRARFHHFKDGICSCSDYW